MVRNHTEKGQLSKTSTCVPFYMRLWHDTNGYAIANIGYEQYR